MKTLYNLLQHCIFRVDWYDVLVQNMAMRVKNLTLAQVLALPFFSTVTLCQLFYSSLIRLWWDLMMHFNHFIIAWLLMSTWQMLVIWRTFRNSLGGRHTYINKWITMSCKNSRNRASVSKVQWWYEMRNVSLCLEKPND